MKIMVTGSAGHLGEALVRTLSTTDDDVVGLDVVDSDYTDVTGSITDRSFVRECVAGADAVIKAST